MSFECKESTIVIRCDECEHWIDQVIVKRNDDMGYSEEAGPGGHYIVAYTCPLCLADTFSWEWFRC